MTFRGARTIAYGDSMKSWILAGSGLIVMTMLSGTVRAQANATPADLRKMAEGHYAWRNQNYPVAASDAVCAPGTTS